LESGDIVVPFEEAFVDPAGDDISFLDDEETLIESGLLTPVGKGAESEVGKSEDVGKNDDVGRSDVGRSDAGRSDAGHSESNRNDGNDRIIGEFAGEPTASPTGWRLLQPGETREDLIREDLIREDNAAAAGTTADGTADPVDGTAASNSTADPAATGASVRAGEPVLATTEESRKAPLSPTKERELQKRLSLQKSVI
jgi:hypothetical protein